MNKLSNNWSAFAGFMCYLFLLSILVFVWFPSWVLVKVLITELFIIIPLYIIDTRK